MRLSQQLLQEQTLSAQMQVSLPDGHGQQLKENLQDFKLHTTPYNSKARRITTCGLYL